MWYRERHLLELDCLVVEAKITPIAVDAVLKVYTNRPRARTSILRHPDETRRSLDLVVWLIRLMYPYKPLSKPAIPMDGSGI